MVILDPRKLVDPPHMFQQIRSAQETIWLDSHDQKLVQITVPKGDVTFLLVASGYRDKPDKIS